MDAADFLRAYAEQFNGKDYDLTQFEVKELIHFLADSVEAYDWSAVE